MNPGSRAMISGFLGVALACAATATLAAAQLPVEQILARNAAARGGLDAWRKVTAVSMTGQMDANKPRSSRPDYHPPMANPKRPASGAAPAAPADDPNKVIELPYRLEMKRPLKTRLEIDFNGKTSVQIYDGVQGFKIRPYLGREGAEPYTPAERQLAAAEQELDGPLIDNVRKGTQVALEGVEKVEGSDAYKLKLTFKNGTVRHLWVDAASFLDVKMDGTRHIDGKPREVDTYLRNYKAVNGLMFPMLTETVIQGVPGSSKLTVASVLVNPAIDDSRFKVDAKPAVAAQKSGAKP
ncbi:MAG: outer membrane lipoprotein-sorting protein [Pseudomonadota bacterium]|nr:outer membrane lipoprotein-sorting protein [Pseudomonadota bacterium]